MRSGIQIEQNDFKIAVEQFALHIKEVNKELESQVKSI